MLPKLKAFTSARCIGYRDMLIPYIVTVSLLLTVATVISMRFPNLNLHDSESFEISQPAMECLVERYEELLGEVKELTNGIEELKKTLGEEDPDKEDRNFLTDQISEKVKTTRRELAAIKAKSIEIVKEIGEDLVTQPARTVTRMAGTMPQHQFKIAYEQRVRTNCKSMGDLYRHEWHMARNIKEASSRVHHFIRSHKWGGEKDDLHIVEEPERLAEFRSKLGEEIHAMIVNAIVEMEEHMKNNDLDPNHDLAVYQLVTSATGQPVAFQDAILGFSIYLLRYKEMLQDCECDKKVPPLPEGYLRTRPGPHRAPGNYYAN